MATHDSESCSAEQASTADEVESSSRRSSTDNLGGDSDYGDDSVSDTDSDDENEKSKSSTLRERMKYTDSKIHDGKTNTQSDTETKNLLDDMCEEMDDDLSILYEMNCRSKQNGSSELDSKLFELSDEQLNYYTNCFLFLMQKTQGSFSLQGALQGNDRTILDFFRKSSLDDSILSKIWSLSDVNEDGFLNLAEFILAMHLVVLHTKGSVPIPSRLPSSVLPPTTPTRTLSVGQQQTVNSKQHSLSDDHLNSQRPMAIAKFSDVPPLLVDGHPTALNAAASSQVLPQFARLFAATARGPPPLPPFRDYNCDNSTGNEAKGHGRSVSLDLKTFSALSSNFDPPSKNAKDEVVSALSAGGKSQPLGNLNKTTNDKPQTNCSTSSVGTQTNCIVDCCEESFSMDNEMAANERCKILQRSNYALMKRDEGLANSVKIR
ncbi:hypothetical protein niasHS_010782 [Heterodera schachtii]|uniref:Uncharacterized protein n=1 Tax=Heterodera schachtii TaxID=97005 RepID=A0ABD2J071_HETSC